MSGTFVSADGQTVTYTDADGQTRTLEVEDGAAVTLNGKKAKLTDLKPGDELAWGGDPATSLTAKR